MRMPKKPFNGTSEIVSESFCTRSQPSISKGNLESSCESFDESSRLHAQRPLA